jgi:hypothetical protein
MIPLKSAKDKPHGSIANEKDFNIPAVILSTAVVATESVCVTMKWEISITRG